MTSNAFQQAEAIQSLLATYADPWPSPFEEWTDETPPQVVAVPSVERERITGLTVLVAPDSLRPTGDTDRCGTLKETIVVVGVMLPISTQDPTRLSPCTTAEAKTFATFVERIANAIESEPQYEVTIDPLIDSSQARQNRLFVASIQVLRPT